MTTAGDIAGSGPPDRRTAVLAALDTIVDPCSRSMGTPIGLVGMGMIERLDVAGDTVSVAVLPTYPACLFQGMFEVEIEKRLRDISWCGAVKVAVLQGDASWDELRMTADARARLRQARFAPATASGR